MERETEIGPEQKEGPVIFVESEYGEFVPKEFIANPAEYFDTHGKQIKPGEAQRGADGRVREDPTAVKDFPARTAPNGRELEVVAKRVNIEKARIAKSHNPFYEYDILQILKEIDLPAPRPVARITQGDKHFFLMTKVKGDRWTLSDRAWLKAKGIDIEKALPELRRQAESILRGLQIRFDVAGIDRPWDTKDMVFDVDWERLKIISVTPTDWEKAVIDYKKLEAYKRI